ncbi:TetR/AcrR family transcriptional regulator [Consotaella aegiceratis]|uniref:TetR/AcrR family transcriptional regulator n=1 Tax=Consotaella aegiceratis TaxID=3097961 RepID=UPI002F42AAFE
MPPKATKRRQQAAKTRAKLSSTALGLIEKRGIENVKIQDIATAAGVSVGVFYHYFPSKQHVIFDLYREADEIFRNDVAPKLDAASAADRILQFFRFYAEFNASQGLKITRVLYNPRNKWFIDRSRYMITLLCGVIQSGQDAGEITCDLTAQDLCDRLFIIARGTVYDWCLHEGTYDLADYMTDMFRRIVPVFCAPGR